MKLVYEARQENSLKLIEDSRRTDIRSVDTLRDILAESPGYLIKRFNKGIIFTRSVESDAENLISRRQ